MNKMLWPAPLKKGDAVALVAPSSPASPDILDKAVRSIKFLGLVPHIFPSCFSRYGYLAGNDISRAEDLNAAFANKTIKGIFCLRGGYGATRILELLDYEMISQCPKVFCGYSDITALHTAFNEKCGFITFHSPMPNTGYYEMDHFSLDSLKKAIFDKNRKFSFENPQGYELKTVSPGLGQGALTGGNLSLLTGTLGSKYQSNVHGKILFIEEVDEILYKVDRMLTALALAGIFDQCSGVILGSFSGCIPGNEESLTLSEIFHDVLAPFNIPIVSGFCAGHSYPQLTLPMGAKIILNATDKVIDII